MSEDHPVWCDRRRCTISLQLTPGVPVGFHCSPPELSGLTAVYLAQGDGEPVVVGLARQLGGMFLLPLSEAAGLGPAIEQLRVTSGLLR